ncbi:MAG: TonB-dependent receptor, partial [Xanthomonadales bacterium]|nr:TonB-dependent receptor [Xanthomonadales bacterium]
MNIAQFLPQAGKPIAKPFTKPFTRPFTVLLTGLLSLNAIAQASSTGDDEVTAESPAELDELVVTAGLAPLSARDVASSITIITREDIEARQVRFVADILRDVPGFSVNQSGGPGAQTQLRVRGAEANQMLVLVDGVRANDAASTDEFQWQYALTSDVERIEIVRGPQSAIWGSDAVGGVVNIIRRKGSTVNHLGGRAELGSFGTTDLALDGAWAGDNLRLRGGLSYYDTDGINASLVGSEKDGTENTSLSAGLEWQISEALELLASMQATDATSEFDDFDFFVTGLPQDADRVTEAEQAYWRGELRFAPGDSIWSGNASLNYTDADNLNFSDGALNSRTAAETLEFRARGSALLEGARGGQHRFTAGLDYRQTDFLQRGIATDFGDPNQDQSLDVTGLAAEYVGQPFAGLTWTVSGRHDSNSEFDDISTWQIALSHQVQENVHVRGSYGTASKAPTFTERFGFFEDFFLGNPDLKPEESRGYEFGVDTTWFDGVLSLGGAYFSTRLENEINGFAFDPAQGAFTA